MHQSPGELLQKGLVAGRLLGAVALRRPRPVLLAWCLTNRCNLSCVMCRRPRQPTAELPHGRMLELCDELPAAGVARVSLTGGEPLSHPLCVDIARRLGAAGLAVDLNSNGALLPQYLPRLRGALSSVSLSLDGPRAQHDQVRGEGSFDQVVAATRAARAEGLAVELHATLSAINVQYVARILAVAEELGVRVGFNPVQEVQSPDAETYARLRPPAARWRAAMDLLLDRKRGGCRTILNSTAGLRHLGSWPRFRPIRCAAGLVYGRIEPDGGLHACGSLVRRPGAPSLARQSFSAAFAALTRGSCATCWCDTRVEMNLVLSGNPSAILEMARR